MVRLSSVLATTLLLAAGCGSEPGTGGDGPDGEGGNSSGHLEEGDFSVRFPGAGTGGAADPIPGAEVICFYDVEGGDGPAASVEWVVEIADEGDDLLRIRLTLDPAFVDNVYGTAAQASGWSHNRGHTLRDLHKSDHAEILLDDAGGNTPLHFAIDLLEEDTGSGASGFSSLGVSGGNGKMIIGDASDVADTATSLDRNLNERGYSSYIESSPLPGPDYAPDPAAPEWDFRVVYEAWVSEGLFEGGFGQAYIEYVHASPAKGGADTVVVEPGECPPDWQCTDPDGCDVGTGGLEGEGEGEGQCTDPDGCGTGSGGEGEGEGEGECTDPDGCAAGSGGEGESECTDPDGCDTGSGGDDGEQPIIE